MLVWESSLQAVGFKSNNLLMGRLKQETCAASATSPPHIYLDGTWYIITSAIYQRQRLLQPNGFKDIVRDQLRSLTIEFKIKLAAWAILDNHFHILIKTETGAELSRFIGRLHGSTSFEINGRDDKRGRQMWHNYWDTCIRGERDFWVRFNYIHHNPVKHGYAKHMQDWEFGLVSRVVIPR